MHTPALEILDQALVDAAEGKNPWLIFTMSPQEGKSQRVSRNFPLWLLVHNPHLRVAVVSYADALARRWGRVVRNDVRERPELGLTIRADTGAANEWQIDGYDGGVITAGIGSGLTGRPVDCLIIDDPLKDQKEADSETIRQTCKDFWQTTASSRLSETSIVIVVMCMTGDTPVLMGDGIERPLRDVRSGDVIATYETGTLTNSKVLNWTNQGPDNIYEIRMKSGVSVRANARHPFLTVEDGVETWQRTDMLGLGSLILRATGGSGAGSTAHMTDANSLRSAKACACRTTTRLAGRGGIAPLRSTQSPDEMPGSNIDMASLGTPTTSSWRSGLDYAMSVASLRAMTTREHIGAESSVLTTSMTMERCAACSATTATSQSATAAPPSDSVRPLNTWSVALDEVLEVVPAGIEDVFDLQVERTENFIANGLVSHNTRWHEDDLAGWLMENHAQDFVHINIPAQAEHDPSAGEVDILGREPGEYMISARARTHAGWEKRKRSAGSRGWNALYQGRPAPQEGGIFKRNWWIRYRYGTRAVQRSDGTMHALGAKVVIQTWDMAFKDTDGSDFVCGQVWAASGSRAWLVDQVCERLEFTDTVDAVVALSAKWPQAKRKYIEDKANGPAVISALRGKVGGIIPYTPVDSKLARARSIAPFVEAGDVEIPEDAPWTQAFVEQHAAFPNGANDDMVDDTSLALIKLLLEGLGNEFMEELTKEQDGQFGPAFKGSLPAVQKAVFGNGWTPQTSQ